MDIESKETLVAAGEVLIASFFGNLTAFVDESLPKVEATADRIIDKVKCYVDNEVTRLSAYKIGLIR